MTEAAVTTTLGPGRTEIAIRGEIDLANHAAVQAQVNQGIDNRTTAVRIDLTDVTFIDSTGLRVLFALVTTLERLQVGLELCAPPSSPARRVIDLSGLSSLVRVAPDP
ncbi:MAG TPA: STAS domain-containing protein [Acidimicrobiales bacterium]